MFQALLDNFPSIFLATSCTIVGALVGLSLIKKPNVVDATTQTDPSLADSHVQNLEANLETLLVENLDKDVKLNFLQETLHKICLEKIPELTMSILKLPGQHCMNLLAKIDLFSNYISERSEKYKKLFDQPLSEEDSYYMDDEENFYSSFESFDSSLILKIIITLLVLFTLFYFIFYIHKKLNLNWKSYL